jgi:hypothetical protein
MDGASMGALPIAQAGRAGKSSATIFPARELGELLKIAETAPRFRKALPLRRKGFPADYLGIGKEAVDMKIEGGSFRLRSARTASSYVGTGAPALLDEDRFVDTGDMVERSGSFHRS